MLRLITICCLSLLVGSPAYSDFNTSSNESTVYLCCRSDNDLYRILNDNNFDCVRFDNPAAAVTKVPRESSLLILADNYPQKTTRITPRQFKQAQKKKLRLYIEYPDWLPGLKVSEPQPLTIERAVIASNFFGPNLRKLRIMSINSKYIVPINTQKSHIVAARVAGFDTAVYGLPEETVPVLFHRTLCRQ